jgi:hypothetical protein
MVDDGEFVVACVVMEKAPMVSLISFGLLLEEAVPQLP